MLCGTAVHTLAPLHGSAQLFVSFYLVSIKFQSIRLSLRFEFKFYSEYICCFKCRKPLQLLLLLSTYYRPIIMYRLQFYIIEVRDSLIFWRNENRHIPDSLFDVLNKFLFVSTRSIYFSFRFWPNSCDNKFCQDI